LRAGRADHLIEHPEKARFVTVPGQDLLGSRAASQYRLNASLRARIRTGR
jgi:hypothetical protein